MKKIKQNKAHTLAELTIVLLAWAATALISLSIFKGINHYIQIVKLKNINMEFRNALDAIITNTEYYPKDSDLATSDKTKFRNLLLKELKVSKSEPLSCNMMYENKKITAGSCYAGTNNVVWCIPDTDFKEENIVNAKNPSGSIYKYVPVTIYPGLKNISTALDFDKYAIVYGIRRDGDFTIINNIDCNENEHKNYNQCKSVDIVSANK